MFAVRFGLRIFIDPPGAVHIYIYIYTASDTSQSFSFIYHSEYDPNTAKKANYNLKQVEKPRKKESRA